ncbi:MAG TPA: nucleotidyltransferase [Gammaproteobacteria bacterium]|nr:nucleotidyltransferase [Gammaproteobacteria bacterium]
MSADSYLNSIITKYGINEAGVKARVNEIYPTIQQWAGIYLNEAIYSGSLAKCTAVSLGTDADIFISLSSTTPDTLSQIYNSLYTALTQNSYQVRKQNVSIGVAYGGYKIDFVPGKRQSQYGYDHSLYKNKTGSWTKTNVNTHVSHVASSRRTREIKILKIWRQLNGLDFPSFYLELAAIDFLSGKSTTNLSGNCWDMFGFLEGGFINRRYIDPANTNNIISDDLSYSEKLTIQGYAKIARTKSTWQEIVW